MPAKTFNSLLRLAFISVASITLADPPSSDLRFSNDKRELLQVLIANTDPYATAKACQRWAEIGDGQAIEPLAKLLTDPHLSNYARNALEGIPDPKAGYVLRASLGQVQGDLLVGVIGSIGRLRDAAAIDELARLIDSDDPAVAEAAGRGLARIGTTHAAEILQSKFAAVPMPLQRAYALACLQCAQRLLQENEVSSGRAMLDFLRESQVADEVKMAAAVQSILAEGSAAPGLLLDQIRSVDETAFIAALQALRQMRGNQDALAIALADELPKLSTNRQPRLIRAIGDLKPRLALPTVRELAKSGGPDVRMEAIRLLGQQQDATALEILLAAAVSQDSRLASAARTSLADWPSVEVDRRILELLVAKDVVQVEAAVELSGRRRLDKAAGLLVPIAKGPDIKLQLRALEALGECGTFAELEPLIDIATDEIDTDARQAARAALRAACIRLPQSSCATAIDQSLAKSTGQTRIYLMEQLAVVGGREALASIAKAAMSFDVEQQDAATRLLGEWLTPDVAPILSALSKSLTDDRFKTRAIRGYIRVARQLDMPLEDRIAICRQALTLSNRPDERSLVMTVLKQYPSPSGLELATSMLESPVAREASCASCLAIAEKLHTKHPNETRQALAKIIAIATSPETIADCKALLARLPPG